MSKAETEPPKNKRKSGKGKALLLILLPLFAGGGGFYAAFAGLLPFGGSSGAEPHGAAPADSHAATPAEGAAADHAAPEGDHAASVSGGTADVAFVEVPPIVISLGSSARARQLHFAAHLEVTRGSEAAVAGLMPRILDVLNGYLRAVEVADLEERATLIRLRAQMLRRVRLVAGPEVKNLLVGEFILN